MSVECGELSVEWAKRNCAEAQKGSSGTLTPSLPVGAVIGSGRIKSAGCKRTLAPSLPVGAAIGAGLS